MSTSPSKPEKGSPSPAKSPDEQQKVLGGMPPIKNEDAIDKENTPKKAPDIVRGR